MRLEPDRPIAGAAACQAVGGVGRQHGQQLSEVVESPAPTHVASWLPGPFRLSTEPHPEPVQAFARFDGGATQRLHYPGAGQLSIAVVTVSVQPRQSAPSLTRPASRRVRGLQSSGRLGPAGVTLSLTFIYSYRDPTADNCGGSVRADLGKQALA